MFVNELSCLLNIKHTYRALDTLPSAPDHIADLQEALNYLSESPHRQPKLELQADTIIDEKGNVQRVFYINPQREDAEDLASTFSDLSMSTLTC